MWSLYLTATKVSKRPSELLEFWIDPWTAYQLDAAVIMVGTGIENALQELENVGTPMQPKYQPKYRLAQLLKQDFRLPAPKTEREMQKSGIEALKALKGVRVRRVGARRE